MANLFPFRALRYTAKAGDLSALVAPHGEAFFCEPPYSAGFLPQGGTGQMEEWQENGILKRETMPAFYFYEQEFFHLGRTRRVKGVIGLLEPGEDSSILLQEEAGESAAKEARRAMESPVLSPLALLYRQEDEAALERIALLTRAKPRYRFRQGGVTHRLWVVNDPVALAAVRQDFAGKPLLLAGSAAQYKAFLRRGGRIPVFLMEDTQSGITLVPFHCAVNLQPGQSREALFRACAPSFALIERENPQEISANLDALYRQGKTAFAVSFGGPRWTLMILKETINSGEGAPPRTDNRIFREYVLKPLGIAESAAEWLPSMEQMLARADEETGGTAFLLNPPRLKQVEALTAAGEKLPPKTASFLPQVPDGLVIAGETM